MLVDSVKENVMQYNCQSITFRIQFKHSLELLEQFIFFLWRSMQRKLLYNQV